MAEEILLLKVRTELESSIKDFNKLEQAINQPVKNLSDLGRRATAARKLLKELQPTAGKTFDDLVTDLTGAVKGTDEFIEKSQQLKQQQETLQRVINENSDAQKEFNRQLRLGESASGYYNELSNQLAKLTKEYKGLSQAQLQSEQGENLAARISEIDSELKQLDANVGKFQRNVGDYENAVRNALLEYRSLPEINSDLQKQSAELSKIGAEQRKLRQVILAVENGEKGALEQAERLSRAYRQQGIEGKQAQDVLAQALIRNKRIADDLEQEINQGNRALKGFQMNASLAQKAFAGFTGAFGALTLDRVIDFGVDGVRDAVSLYSDYTAQLGVLNAVTGATAKEQDALRASSDALALSTKFTNTQIVELQTEYAKLGFRPDEILQATDATQNLAKAFDQDLGRTAGVIASTLNAFNLEATESGNVADKLGRLFASSATDLSKFETAIGTVLPVAKSFGFDLDGVLAILGKFNDAGFDASSGATALRNIFLNLADTNGNLAQALGRSVTNTDELIPALNELKDSGIDLAGTLELTDKRSVAAFNALLSGADDVQDLTNELRNAEGTAKELGRAFEDSAAGDLAKLTSQIQGQTIQAFTQLDGTFRGFVQFITTSIGVFGNFINLLIRNGDIVKTLTLAYIALNAIQIKNAVTNSTLVQRVVSVTTALLGQTAATNAADAATKRLTISQRLFNRVAAKNVYVVIAAAIVTLLGLLRSAYDRNEQFRASVDGALNAGLAFGKAFNDNVLPVLVEVGSVLVGVSSATQQVTASLGITTEGARQFASEFIEYLRDVNSAIYNFLFRPLISGFDSVSPLLQKLGIDFNGLGADFKQAFDEGKQASLDASNGLTEISIQAQTAKTRASELDSELSNFRGDIIGRLTLKGELEQANKEADLLNTQLLLSRKIAEGEGDFFENQILLEETKAALAELSGESIDTQNKIKAASEEVVKESANTINETTKSATDSQKKLIEGTIPFFEDQISKLNEKLSDLGLGDTEQAIKIRADIDLAQENIDAIKRVFEGGDLLPDVDEGLQDGLIELVVEAEKFINVLDGTDEELADLNEITREQELINRAILATQEKATAQANLELGYKQSSKDLAIEEKEIREQILQNASDTSISDEIRLSRQQALQNQLIDLERQKEEQRLQFVIASVETEQAIREQAQNDLLKLHGERVAQEVEQTAQASREKGQIEIDDRQAINEFLINTAQLVSDTLFNISSQNFEREQQKKAEFLDAESEQTIERLNQRQERELEQAEGNKEKEEQINKKFDALRQKELEKLDKEKAKLEKETFERNKRFAIAQAAINGALSITAITTVPDFTLGIASALRIAAVVAQTAAQIAVIASQQFGLGGVLDNFYKMSRGGYLNFGKSHASGGIKARNRNTGRVEAEFERGEAITNKRTTSRFYNEISLMNEAGGGTPFPNAVRLSSKQGRSIMNGIQGNRPSIYEKGGFFGSIPRFVTGGFFNEGTRSSDENISNAIIKSNNNVVKGLKAIFDIQKEYNDFDRDRTTSIEENNNLNSLVDAGT